MRLLLVIAMLAFAACTKVPVSQVKAGATALKQSGAVAVPAKAESITSRATLPLPAGTRIEVVSSSAGKGAHRAERDLAASDVAMRPGVVVTLPEPAVLSVETVHERATAPQAFEPPAPPTPSDEADGKAVLYYRIALGVGVAAFLFGLVRDWPLVMIGGGVVAGGSAFGLFVERHPWLLAVIGAGVALAVGGVCVWHFMLKKKVAAT